MKKYLFILAAAATILAACAKETEFDTPESRTKIEAPENGFVCSFALNDKVQTKTTIAPDQENNPQNYLINWELNDQISVDNGTKKVTFTASNAGAKATFTTTQDVSDFFGAGKTYTATFGTKYSDNSTKTYSVTNGSASHIYMTAECTEPSHEFTFSTAEDEAVLAVKMPVTAKSLEVKSGDTSIAKLASSTDTPISVFYVPVPSGDNKRYEIYAYSGNNYNELIAESMKMYSTQTMAKQTIYPFTFVPTLKITAAGTYSLKSYAGDYKVWICNSDQTNGAGTITDALTIQYDSNAASHPANIYVDGKNSTVNNLIVTTPESHVELSNGISGNVTSKTNSSTLVVKPTYSITTALTAKEGSVTVEGKVDNNNNTVKNVEKIILDYGSDKTNMAGVVISVAEVTSGGPVIIVNKTTQVSNNETPITVVGTNNSENESTSNGGFKIEKVGEEIQSQNINAVANAVAKVGDKVFSSIADAIGNTTDDQFTVTLIADEITTAAQGPTIGDNKNITIDLAGHTITADMQNSAACAVFNIKEKGSLTMKDSGNDGKVILCSSVVGNWPDPNVATNVFTNNGKLTIEGGYYENKGKGNCSYVIDNSSNTGNAVLTIKGGHLMAQYSPIRAYLNSASLTNTVTISGGILEGSYIAYFQQNGKSSSPLACIISGGSFIAKPTEFKDKALHMFYFDVLDAAKIDFEITGGTFQTSNTEKYFVYPDVASGVSTDNCNIQVSGGKFSNENIVSAPAVIAANCEKVEEGEYYLVQPAEGKVAKIGKTTYATLQEAFAAAKDNDTLELLCDVDLKNEAWTPAVFNNKTFDGKGHTIKNLKVTGNNKAQGFIGNGDCSTIKNLTIDGASVTGINHVGVIAGRGMCTKIENCHVKNASVTSNVYNNDDGDKVAAICGYLSGEWHAWVRNCSVENSTVTGYRDLGAIVGYAECYCPPKYTSTGTADVSNNSAKNVQIICMTDNNYKNYTSNEDCHAGKIVGELVTSSTSDNNTADNVTITYTPGIVSGVAKIGNTPYPTLAAAIAAVPTIQNPANGKSTLITLISNESVTTNGGIEIPYGKNITLDLNGFVLSGVANVAGSAQLIYNKGDLTIKDSSDTNHDGTGTGLITNKAYAPDSSPIPGYASNVIFNRGNLILESGKIVSETEGGAATYPIDNNTQWWETYKAISFTMTGGCLYNAYSKAIRLAAHCFDNGVTGNTVNISGGVIEGTQAIWIQNFYKGYATLNITGGTLKGETKSILITSGNDSGTWNLLSDSATNTKFYISGQAKINGIIDIWIADRATPNADIKYTGGYFTSSPTTYVPSGYIVQNNTGSDSSTYPYTIVQQ